MGSFHLVQGILVLMLANDFSLPVTANFMEGPPGSPQSMTTLFSINIGWACSRFCIFIRDSSLYGCVPGNFRMVYSKSCIQSELRSMGRIFDKRIDNGGSYRYVAGHNRYSCSPWNLFHERSNGPIWTFDGAL